jgi:P4 family phage/plasmid primase-like protien
MTINNNRISIFESKKFIEIADKNIIKQMIGMDFGSDDFGVEYNTILKSYFKKIKRNKVSVSYSLKSQRVFANNSSLQGFKRCIRHTIAEDNYVDVDIVNSAPTMLLQILKINKIKTPYLKKYVEDRDLYINKLIKKNKDINRDIAKNLFIVLLMGGSIKGWITKNNLSNIKLSSFVQKFANEMNGISKIIMENNPDVVEYCREQNKPNIRGSVMSMFLNHFETIVLEHTYDFLVENKLIKNNNCVLCFDGIMILKNDKINDFLLFELSKYIKQKTNLNVEYKIKPMNESLDLRNVDVVEDINDCMIIFSDNEEEGENVKSEEIEYVAPLILNEYDIVEENDKKLLQLEKIILEGGESMLTHFLCEDIMPYVKYVENDVYYCWNEKTKLWGETTSSTPKHLINGILYEYIEDLLIIYKDQIRQNGNDETISKKVSDICKFRKKMGNNSFLSNILSLSRDYLYEEKFLDMIDFDRFCLPIGDGKKINIKNKSITERTINDYFSYEINVKYTKNNNVFRDFMRTIFDEDEEYNFIQKLFGYFISGENKEQIFPIMTNEFGGNGKSLIITLMYKLFGRFMVNMDINLITDKKNINEDAEKNKLYKSRLAIFNETNFEGNLDIEMIKMLTGGDVIKARDCFQKGKDVKELITAHKLLLLTQNLPNLKKADPAFKRRLLPIPFKYYFRNVNDKDYNPEDPNCKITDNTLLDKLLVNLDDVFSWFIDGTHKYFEEQKPLLDIVPESFRAFTDEYYEVEDTLKEFINDGESGPELYTKVVDFYELYMVFMNTNNYDTNGISNRWVAKQMRINGFVKITKIIEGKKWKVWDGIQMEDTY